MHLFTATVASLLMVDSQSHIVEIGMSEAPDQKLKKEHLPFSVASYSPV